MVCRRFPGSVLVAALAALMACGGASNYDAVPTRAPVELAETLPASESGRNSEVERPAAVTLEMYAVLATPTMGPAPTLEISLLTPVALPPIAPTPEAALTPAPFAAATSTPEPTPTSAPPEPTPGPQATIAPTVTTTVPAPTAPVYTPSPTARPTATAVPTSPLIVVPTPRSTPLPTTAPTSGPTPTPPATPVVTASPSPAPSPLPVPSPSVTPAPLGSLAPLPTATSPPVATPSPSPVPVASPTAPATQTPVPSPAASAVGTLGIQVVSLTSPIAAGQSATLVAHTTAGAQCSITVRYKSGPSGAAGLDSKNADSAGNVSWTWRVGGGTSAGSWTIDVRASLGGQTVSKTVDFVVTNSP